MIKTYLPKRLTRSLSYLEDSAYHCGYSILHNSGGFIEVTGLRKYPQPDIFVEINLDENLYFFIASLNIPRIYVTNEDDPYMMYEVQKNIDDAFKFCKELNEFEVDVSTEYA